MEPNRVAATSYLRDVVTRGFIALAIALAAPADAGEVARVSVGSAGAQTNATSVSAGNRALTSDARFVAFQSTASNLVPGDTNGVEDIFVHDRLTGTTSRVSLVQGGGQATRTSTKMVTPDRTRTAVVRCSISSRLSFCRANM